MSKFIFSQDYVLLTDSMLSVRAAEQAGYPKVHVADWWDLNRKFMDGDGLANDWLLKIDFGTTQILSGLFINHTNISEVTIQGSADDTTYTDVAASQVISLDSRVSRYKVFIGLSSFTYRYLRIFIPSGASKTDNGSYWWISSIVPMASYYSLGINPSWGYTYSVSQGYAEIKKGNGSIQRVAKSDNKVFSYEMTFGIGKDTDVESTMNMLNSFNLAKPLIFYENQGNDAHAYLCVQDNSLSVRWEGPGVMSGSTLRLKEIV